MHENLNARGLMRKLTWQDVCWFWPCCSWRVCWYCWSAGQSTVRPKAAAAPAPDHPSRAPLPGADRCWGHCDRGADSGRADIPEHCCSACQHRFGLGLRAEGLWQQSCGGVVTILENTYQPGDWIEVDGTYGEVKAIGLRAVHLVTRTIPRLSFLTRGSGRPAFSTPAAAIEVSSAWRISIFTPTTTLLRCGDG